ncbi:Crp/Fnr family transcriptional regulator [Sporolactobacillus sp. Y61]|uniref:Crp/Fnr family transcriptional regulator n=1 Tax=Sporolactobacillus sp. Y61 TaxID=3160863 RepID=A0AAU8IGP6_9BACL|nr:Crp/Fnr family transcriptional regulator [Sporolactobacillus sp. THM19-2]RYL92579.1 Crp/Fnr family transcriptional regulator [Sporolactobacillus sp. THM19-2]
MNVHQCVAVVPLFSQLNEEDRGKIDTLVNSRVYQKGEQVIRPDGEPQLIIVARGAVKIYQLSHSGKEQLLRVAGPGDYEGESALFGVRNDSLFGEALQETVICLLTHRDFESLLLTHPQLSLKLLEINAKKAVSAERQTQFLMMEKVETRVATYLLNLMKSEKSATLHLPMKMKELAAFLGTTSETLSRKFRLLQDEGLISRKGRQVTIVRPQELGAFHIDK